MNESDRALARLKAILTVYVGDDEKLAQARAALGTITVGRDSRLSAVEAERDALLDRVTETSVELMDVHAARIAAEARVEALSEALQAVCDIPSPWELMNNAPVKAMYTYARQGLAAASPEPERPSTSQEQMDAMDPARSPVPEEK